MSHIPLNIEDEQQSKQEDWITHTAKTTQNQEGGWFNNWYLVSYRFCWFRLVM